MKCSDAINLADISAHPAEALAALIKVVQLQGEEIERIKKRHKDFAVRTTNEIDELFAKIAPNEPNPSPKQRDRREILRGLLVVNGGKMFASDARKKIGMDEASFSRLVSKMGNSIEVKKSAVNKRKNLLILKSEKG